MNVLKILSFLQMKRICKCDNAAGTKKNPYADIKPESSKLMRVKFYSTSRSFVPVR